MSAWTRAEEELVAGALDALQVVLADRDRDTLEGQYVHAFTAAQNAPRPHVVYWLARSDYRDVDGPRVFTFVMKAVGKDREQALALADALLEKLDMRRFGVNLGVEGDVSQPGTAEGPNEFLLTASI